MTRLAGRGLVEDGHVVAGHPALAVEVLAGGDPVAVEPHEGGGEPGVGGEGGLQVPVVGGHERHALALPLDHQAHGRRLHPPRGQRRSDLAPQHLGHGVAEEPVDDAPGLLGVDQAGVDVAGLLDRLLDRLAGDLVEHHPLGGHPRVEHLGEVPGDGLALAILISREIELVGGLERGLQLADDIPLARRHHIAGFEAVVDVDRKALGVEVTDGADRRLDDEIVAQEPGDGARLGRRLDDHERRGHRPTVKEHRRDDCQTRVVVSVGRRAGERRPGRPRGVIPDAARRRRTSIVSAEAPCRGPQTLEDRWKASRCWASCGA